jgi:hypothetical protein
MQIHSTTALKKGEPFDTGIQELNNLMSVYWDQLNAMADAEQSGQPEPDCITPALPSYVVWTN